MWRTEKLIKESSECCLAMVGSAADRAARDGAECGAAAAAVA